MQTRAGNHIVCRPAEHSILPAFGQGSTRSLLFLPSLPR